MNQQQREPGREEVSRDNSQVGLRWMASKASSPLSVRHVNVTDVGRRASTGRTAAAAALARVCVHAFSSRHRVLSDASLPATCDDDAVFRPPPAHALYGRALSYFTRAVLFPLFRYNALYLPIFTVP